jgi:hypothetical protein
MYFDKQSFSYINCNIDAFIRFLISFMFMLLSNLSFIKDLLAVHTVEAAKFIEPPYAVT